MSTATVGYSPQELGRRAAERAALERGTLVVHMFEANVARELRAHTTCARCGGRRDAPIHEAAIAMACAPSGRRARKRSRRGYVTLDSLG